MSPRTAEENERLRLSRKKEIIESAVEVISVHGAHDTSMSMIAKEAGISKGLIYAYFDNKEQLYRAIVAYGFEILSEVFGFKEDRELTDEILSGKIDRVFDMLKSDSAFWGIYLNVIMQREMIGIMRDLLMEYFEPFFNQLNKYYERKGAEDPLAMTMLFGAALDGISINYMVREDEFPLERVKNLVKTIFIR